MKISENPSTAVEELVKLLSQQKRYYSELLDLAGQQRQLIEQQDSEQLLSLLSRRQRIVDDIGKVHKQILPYQENWDELKSQLDESSRDRVQVLLDDLDGLLKEVLANDEKDCKELMTKKDQISEQLSSANKGSAVNQAYGGPGGSSPASSGGTFEISG